MQNAPTYFFHRNHSFEVYICIHFCCCHGGRAAGRTWMGFATQVKLVSPLDYLAEEENREGEREREREREVTTRDRTHTQGRTGRPPTPRPTTPAGTKRGLSEVSLTLTVRTQPKKAPVHPTITAYGEPPKQPRPTQDTRGLP